MKFTSQHKQPSLDFIRYSLDELPKDNRWVRLGDSLPWNEIEWIYNSKLNNKHAGSDNKPARMVIGTLIIRYKMFFFEEETIEAIQENPYIQYMLGFSEFTDKPLFDASLFVTIRKRLGVEDFNGMSQSVVRVLARQCYDKINENYDEATISEAPSLQSDTTRRTHEGGLKTDATCCDAEIRCHTDLEYLYDGLKVVDRIIGRICEKTGMEKLDTHLKALHSKCFTIIKFRSKSKGKVHGCMEYLLTWIHRNIWECVNLIDGTSIAVFEGFKLFDRELLVVVLRAYHQQKEMFSCDVHRCLERIVSIFQLHIRPIVSGKDKAKVEGASIVKGYTFIDCHSWEAYNECEDLMIYLKNYKRRFGLLFKKVETDKIYLNRMNRWILKLLKVEIGGKPLGWLSKEQQIAAYQQ